MLIKPHGSIEWGQRVAMSSDLAVIVASKGSSREQERQLIDFALDLRDTGTIRFHGDYRPVIHHPVNGDEFFLPALAIPFDRKSTFVCPEEHISVLKEALGATTHILVIGWRATEDAFFTLLREHCGKLEGGTIVNGPGNAVEAAEHLRDAGLGVDWRQTPWTFTELVQTQLEHLLESI